jgi:hypothetical protein
MSAHLDDDRLTREPNRDRLRYPTREEQRTARIMGAWFLGTFVFSIPAFIFYDPLLNHARYVTGSGQDTRIGIGALLEVMLAICGIATAVVIFPIAKRVSESVALGYVATRTVESILILVGVLSLMSIVALRQDAGNDGGLVDAARSLSSPSTTRPPCLDPSSAQAWATASCSVTSCGAPGSCPGPW